MVMELSKQPPLLHAWNLWTSLIYEDILLISVGFEGETAEMIIENL